MKKKTYLAPLTRVVRVQNAQIICTSLGYKTETLDEENFNWDE